MGSSRNGRMERNFPVILFSGILGQACEVNSKFWHEIPENVCTISSPTRNFRNFWSNGKSSLFHKISGKPSVFRTYWPRPRHFSDRPSRSINNYLFSTEQEVYMGESTEMWVPGGGVLPYKGLMGTCGQPGYVFRDFCLKQGIEFIIFCLNQGIDFSIFVLNRISFLGR